MGVTAEQWRERCLQLAEEFRGVTRLPAETGDEVLSGVCSRAGHLLWQAYTGGLIEIWEAGRRFRYDRVFQLDSYAQAREFETIWICHVMDLEWDNPKHVPPNPFALKKVRVDGNTTCYEAIPEYFYQRALNYSDICLYLARPKVTLRKSDIERLYPDKVRTTKRHFKEQSRLWREVNAQTVELHRDDLDADDPKWEVKLATKLHESDVKSHGK
jgi:hypothetical protein